MTSSWRKSKLENKIYVFMIFSLQAENCFLLASLSSPKLDDYQVRLPSSPSRRARLALLVSFWRGMLVVGALFSKYGALLLVMDVLSSST